MMLAIAEPVNEFETAAPTHDARASVLMRIAPTRERDDLSLRPLFDEVQAERNQGLIIEIDTASSGIGSPASVGATGTDWLFTTCWRTLRMGSVLGVMSGNP
jgi:hypothetical protein